MAPISGPLNNVNLDEQPLAVSAYNALPHIDDMHDAAKKHARAHAKLLGLIVSHGLGQIFSIHLVHKHFDLPEGRVMVYEKVQGQNHPGFVLSSPRDPNKTAGLRGLYFRATPAGKMEAYEYTTETGKDIGQHAEFVALFAKTIMALGVQDVFALTVQSFHSGVLTEFEMSDLNSTILVKNATWLPSNDSGTSTSTDWIATPDYKAYANLPTEGPEQLVAQKCTQGRNGTHLVTDSNGLDDDDDVPGIVQLKCTKTRSGSHFNVTCSRTRNGRHYQKKRASEKSDDSIFLDDTPVPFGSEGYAIISQGREMVERYWED